MPSFTDCYKLFNSKLPCLNTSSAFFLVERKSHKRERTKLRKIVCRLLQFIRHEEHLRHFIQLFDSGAQYFLGTDFRFFLLSIWPVTVSG